MTLRQQIHDIAVRWVNRPWADMVNFDMQVDQLAAIAFDQGLTPTSDRDSRAIARARQLMAKPGWIGLDEEGVK